MKIAILSDSHDNRENLFQALKTIQQLEVEMLLFCGDFCSPFITKEIAEIFNKPIHVVFGNNDGDRFRMAMNVKPHAHVTLHGEHAALKIDNKRIGMTHYPFYATSMAKSGDFDLVAFGHDHEARILSFGDCLAINPGCLMNSKNTNPPSFALYDTAAHAATLHALDGSILTI